MVSARALDADLVHPGHVIMHRLPLTAAGECRRRSSCHGFEHGLDLRRDLVREHIATEPISGHEREQVIIALATLITAWQHIQDQPDSAAPLPLPGPASDTDHAA